MKLILCDTNKVLCQQWNKYFCKIKDVTIVNDTFTNLQEFDCIVSPANSFGLMDGGFDLALINYFGYVLMQNIQKQIIADYAGEQPVGTSIIVETGNKKHPYCAHTPTMRVPQVIKGYDTVYNAMRAMLLAVSKHKDITSVLCPGLGTATGQVPIEIAAKQMYLAYENIANPPAEVSWQMAMKTERRLL